MPFGDFECITNKTSLNVRYQIIAFYNYRILLCMIHLAISIYIYKKNKKQWISMTFFNQED